MEVLWPLAVSVTMVRLKGVPPFERALFWHANAAPRCIVYLPWWIPVHCCWAEPAKEIGDFARQIGADLIVVGHRRQSDGTQAGAAVQLEDDFTQVPNEGVARLRQLGFEPVSKLVRGEPAKEIGDFARQIGADLIVVGHRRQSAFDRWWSGPRGAYLIDYTECSLLLARNVVSDEPSRLPLSRVTKRKTKRPRGRRNPFAASD